MMVLGFAWCEDSGYVVYRLLKREFVSILLSFDDVHRTYDLVCVADMYNNIGSLTLGAARIGLLAKRSFISSNPAVAASVHSK